MVRDPGGQEQAIFDKFARGNKESAIPGVGLGWPSVRPSSTCTAGPFPPQPPAGRRLIPCYTAGKRP
jgi:hypothetical protein